MRRVSFFELSAATFKLIWRDSIILTPYLFFFLLISSWDILLSEKSTLPISLNISLPMIGAWLLSLAFKGLTILIATDLYRNQKIVIKNTLNTFSKRCVPLLLSHFILVLPFYFFSRFFILSPQLIRDLLVRYFTFLNPTVSSVPFENMELWIGLVCLVPIVLLLEFLPILVLSEKESSLQSIAKTFFFVKNNFMIVLLFSFFIMGIILFSLLLSGFLVTAIPLFGKSLLQTVIQSLVSCYIYTLAVIFYYQSKSRHSYSV